ncbi:hypothetical protein ACIHIX_37030 [Streptomyces sp. NPDC051913]|uniref:hypothetical protein n=1 Tax=Streptomyces sp. NPDC051913 TaxID=3365676 RepID=UPI0037D6B5F3
MPRTLTVGLDGAPESRAAAQRAESPVLGAETLRHWSERVARAASAGLAARPRGGVGA